MSLPGWISPRMKEIFAKTLEELFLYQPNGIITFSTQGVMLKDDNGLQHYSMTQDLCQYPEFLNNFPSDDIIIFEPQLSVPPSEIFDCSEFLKDFDESTIDEEIIIPSTSTIDSSEIIELAESVNLIPTTEVIEEQQSESSDDEWKFELEEKVKRTYNKRMNKTQKLVNYFEIGEILHSHPLKHERQLQKLKRTICRNIKQNFNERPFFIATRTYKIFKTKEKVLQSIHNLTPDKIFRLNHQEVRKYSKDI